LCRRLSLFTQALVVIDGSRFKAVNNRDRNFMRAKMKRRLAQIEVSLDGYFEQLERADCEESSLAALDEARVMRSASAYYTGSSGWLFGPRTRP